MLLSDATCTFAHSRDELHSDAGMGAMVSAGTRVPVYFGLLVQVWLKEQVSSWALVAKCVELFDQRWLMEQFSSGTLLAIVLALVYRGWP